MNSNIEKQRVLVVSGLSGAGKTVALRALEDFGYYCIDNFPVSLLPELASEIKQTNSPVYEFVAVGIDARNPPDSLKRFPEILDVLESSEQFQLEIIFIEAAPEILLKRFSETRRKHPLTDEGVSLKHAVLWERELLHPISERADLVLDTSTSNLHDLRHLIRERVVSRSRATMSLQFMSFGFKNGAPHDADYVFDVRCLPNPHWDESLREKTGKDQGVIEFLEREDSVKLMVEQIQNFLETWVTYFENENRSYLTVAIGCTGGRHRSVYVSERLAAYFRDAGKDVLMTHRDTIL